MYSDVITKLSSVFTTKLVLIEKQSLRFALSALLAGAYVAFAIIFILTLGSDVPVEIRKLVMGATFGIALVLIMFAGADLFTGYPLYYSSFIVKGGSGSVPGILKALKLFIFVWCFNFIGAIIVAALYAAGKGGVLHLAGSILFGLADYKVGKTPFQLISNGILCNWLVCLAIFIYYRMSSEVGRIIAMSWCLFVFVASGYEHSVANMAVFSLVIFSHHEIDAFLMLSNLFFVTIGNVVGGGLFVGGIYAYLSKE